MAVEPSIHPADRQSALVTTNATLITLLLNLQLFIRWHVHFVFVFVT